MQISIRIGFAEKELEPRARERRERPRRSEIEAIGRTDVRSGAIKRHYADFGLQSQAGDPGIEPGVAVLETTVLPIHQSPIAGPRWAGRAAAEATRTLGGGF